MAVSVIERIASHYRSGATLRKGWLRIPCPSHKGEDNNLAISVGADGGLIMKCHSRQCSYNDILEAFRRDGIEIERTWTYPGGKRVHRTDAPGKPKQIKSVGTNKGVGLLIRNDNEGNRLVIVEGESDSDALVSADLEGVTAACWVGGAALARDADYSAVAGRSVVVWGDNDRQGQASALHAAQKCYLSGAENVRIVAPVGPEKAGAADLTPEDMRRAIDGAMVVDRPTEPVVLGADAPVAQYGDDWVIGPVGAAGISCRARNLVMESGQLYGDLTLETEGTVFRQVLHFPVGSITACKQLSDAVHGASIFMPRTALGSNYGPVPGLDEADCQLMATKIISGIFECWEGGRSLSSLVKRPSDPAPPAPAWLVKPLIADDGILILYGQPGSGKSLMALCAALTAVTGVSFAGLVPPPQPVGSVMYIDWEGTERSFRFRLDTLAGTAGIDPRDLGILYLDATGRGRLRDISTDIARTLSEYRVDLVIIDSASAAVGDTLSPADATETMRAIKSWGIPSLLIAHSPKGAGRDGNKPTVYGAQAYTAAARLAILAEVEAQNKDALQVVIRNGKAGSDLGYIEPRLVTFRFANNRIASVECSEYEERAEATPVKERLIEAFKESGREMLVTELGEGTGLERSAISKALSDGARSNPPVFVEVGRVRNAKRWKLTNV